MKGLDALHIVLLGVHHTQRALITTTQQITHDGTTWFMHIVRATNHNDALWLKKLFVYHRYQVF